MKYRRLGKDLEVSAVGLGCMGMSHAYGAAADTAEMTKIIGQSVELGYTFYDTAEIYGTPDNAYDNEELVGKALKPYRNQVKIATKFGVKFDMSTDSVNHPIITDSRPEVIKASVEGSLKRLQTDHIDLYFQHRMDPKIPVEEVAGVMAELIKAGKITHWGISEATEDAIRRAHAICPLTAVENRYSMMYRDYEALFPLLEELQIGFVPFSPLANGLLSDRYNKESKFSAKDDYRSVMPQYTAEAFDENQALFDLIRTTAKAKDATPAQISLAWMICKKPWIVPIPGTRKLDRLKENGASSEIDLSIEEIDKIDAALDKMKMSEVFGGSRLK